MCHAHATTAQSHTVPNRTNEQTNEDKLDKLSNEWRSPSYKLLTRNCNHFAAAACARFGVAEPPDWINRSANLLSGETASVVGKSVGEMLRCARDEGGARARGAPVEEARNDDCAPSG